MPARVPAGAPPIGLRALGRATLARQLLLRRRRLAPADAIERLSPLQAQWPAAPYLALWSRLAGFRIEHLAAALDRREVVKASLMRDTLHLVSAREYAAYARAALAGQEARLGRGRPDPADLARLRERLHAWAGEGPRPAREVTRQAAALAGLGPAGPAWSLLRAIGGFVLAPESARWGGRGGGDYLLARAYLPAGEPVADATAVALTVRRYLAAFGPAAVSDVASWSHLPPAVVRTALGALEGELVRFVDEDGRVLHDLAGAPRPSPDAPAPVRFLPKWDQYLLAYEPRFRGRVLPERFRRTVIAVNGDVTPTVLVDGVVAARWDARLAGPGAVLSVEPLRRLAPDERAAVQEEGLRLLRFVHPDVPRHDVRVVRPGALPAYNLGLRP